MSNGKNCLGFDELIKIDTKYNWFDTEILKIDPNVLLDGKDALRIYQDYSCLVAKEVVIGLNMKFETKHNNISDNLPVVIGYALDHYCDYKGIVAGYKWIVMDEL